MNHPAWDKLSEASRIAWAKYAYLRRLVLILSLLFCPSAKAQDFAKNYNFTSAKTSATTQSFANTGITSFFISWSPEVSLSSCSVQVDSSTDGISWGSGDLIASQNCTTAGSSGAPQSLGAGKNFVRINVTALVGNGGLNVSLKGWGGGGSGITSVSSLPATCTPGTTSPVQLNVAPYGVYYCSATNQWSASSTAGPNQVNATSYGVKADGRYITDATLATTGDIIDCSFTLDCFFVGALDTGKTCFATNAQSDLSQASTVVLPEGVNSLVVIDATHAHCGGGNATSNCTHACTAVWGHLDSATSVQTQSTANDPMLAFWTAAANACAQGVLPAGLSLIERGEFITFPASGVSGTPYCGQGISIEYMRVGFGLKGQGRAGAGATIIVLTPNFPPTDCTGPNGTGSICLMAFKNPVVSDLQVSGMGNNSCTGFSGKILTAALGDNTAGGSNGLYKNVMFQSWCGNTAGVIGLSLGAGSTFSGLELHDVWSEFFGCTPVDVSGANFVDWYGGSFWGGCSGGYALTQEASNPSTLKTYGLISGSGSNSGAISGATGSTWYDFGSLIYNSTSANATINLKNNTYLDGTTIQLQNAGSYGLYAVTNSINVHLHNFSIIGTVTANHSFFSDTAATMNVFDDGGNVIPTGTVTGSGAFNMFGSTSTTGTACATGNWALTSGWGTSSIASVTAGGDSHRCQVVITGAAGSASPVLTWTFPKVFNFGTVAPGSCQISFNGTLTGESTAAPSTTAVAFTFTGTPSAQTYRLDASCGP